MKALLGRRPRRLAVLVATGLLVAGGVAYATIPSGSGVYTACMLKATGTIRLIDPSLPASNPLSHCITTGNAALSETQISWSANGQPGPAGPAGAQGPIGPQGPAGAQGPAGPKGDPGPQGAAGDPGPAGPAGPTGAAGSSITTSPVAAGDACPNGGAEFTDGQSDTSYACTGAQGATGATGAPGPQGPAGPPGPAGTGGDVWSAFGELAANTSGTVVTIDPPAGNYLLIVTGSAFPTVPDATSCRVLIGGAIFATTASLVADGVPQTISLSTSTSVPSGEAVSVSCGQVSGEGVSIDLEALAVGAIHTS
jgi:hypothetical protein